MSDNQRKSLQELLRKLRQERDELALQMHLGKEDLKDEWDAIQHKLDQLGHRLEPVNKAVTETSEDVWESLKLVGDEIKEGFRRIRKAL